MMQRINFIILLCIGYAGAQAAPCTNNQVLIYLQYKDQKSTSSKINEFKTSDENACTKACSDNKPPNGNVASCQSVDFDSKNNVCQFFAKSTISQLSAATGVNHFEKSCQDPSVTKNCFGPIVIQVQRVLIGQVQGAVNSPDQQDCIIQCLNAEKRYNFKCRSGMFYPKDTTKNCLLNSESGQSKPELLIVETVDTVNYFEPVCSAIDPNTKTTPVTAKPYGYTRNPRKSHENSRSGERKHGGGKKSSKEREGKKAGQDRKSESSSKEIRNDGSNYMKRP